jgi:hypothetical protein
MSVWLDTTGNTVISIAICDRCKMKRPYTEISEDRNIRGLRVCNQGCNDERDPYRLPARQPERISIRFPRPDANIGTPSVLPTVSNPALLLSAQTTYTEEKSDIAQVIYKPSS